MRFLSLRFLALLSDDVFLVLHWRGIRLLSCLVLGTAVGDHEMVESENEATRRST